MPTAATANKVATSEQLVLDLQPFVVQVVTQPARYLVFVIPQQMMHVVDGAFTEPVLMESEPEPELVLLDLHVQPLNQNHAAYGTCLLYTSPSPRDRQKSRMPSSA